MMVASIALSLCVQLLPAAWQARDFAMLDQRIPAGYWMGDATPPDWAYQQGGWAKQGCFLTRRSAEGYVFWFLSNGVDL